MYSIVRLLEQEIVGRINQTPLSLFSSICLICLLRLLRTHSVFCLDIAHICLSYLSLLACSFRSSSGISICWPCRTAVGTSSAPIIITIMYYCCIRTVLECSFVQKCIAIKTTHDNYQTMTVFLMFEINFFFKSGGILSYPWNILSGSILSMWHSVRDIM